MVMLYRIEPAWFYSQVYIGSLRGYPVAIPHVGFYSLKEGWPVGRLLRNHVAVLVALHIHYIYEPINE